ncbi:unnamed protein product [Caenorhabditis brenneri]
MSSFPLLRLPQLAFSGVIDAFDLNVIITASFCSRKMFRLMKIFWRKARKLEINLGYFSKIWTKIIWQKGNEKEEFRINIRPLSELKEKDYELSTIFGNTKVPSNSIPSNNSHFNVYYQNDFEGIKAIAVHITELFSSPIYRLIPDAALYPDGPRRIIDWVLERQESIEDCFVECEKMTDSENAYVLSKCKFMKSFFLGTNYSENFQYDFHFDGEYISLKNCFWFSLNNLLSVNSRYCYVRDTKLTNRDMNTFLKFWTNLGCNRIENVTIWMERIDYSILFDGIEVEKRDRNLVRTFITPDKREMSIPGGLDITRIDGVTATISAIRGSDDCFWMAVWKN